MGPSCCCCCCLKLFPLLSPPVTPGELLLHLQFLQILRSAAFLARNVSEKATRMERNGRTELSFKVYEKSDNKKGVKVKEKGKKERRNILGSKTKLKGKYVGENGALKVLSSEF